MKKKKHVISKVLPGSIAEELELEPGDILLSINDVPVEDVFDYRYQMNDEYVVITVQKKNGELWDLEVEKEFEEDLGIDFDNGLMDEYRSCSNNCVFCFIDQMPPDMRETLYFKDDDSRLSFLQGNYITLTNMSEHDIDRVIRYHLSPINISFQTMNPELRCQMLHNRFAGKALEKVDRLYEAGITMNGQIVLCKGLNDGKELAYSIEQMAKYAPMLQSVSIVPVGLTKFRDGLYPLEPFTKEEAWEVISLVHKWQEKMMAEHGIHFVHASDEWYILAELELPQEDSYDGYLQLENGVGMLRLLDTEVTEGLLSREGDERSVKATIATGKLAGPYVEKQVAKIKEKYPNIDVTVKVIRNDFFGEKITVSGLITGQDLIAQLKDTDIGEKLLIPCSMLRDEEEVFLDDLTIADVSKALNVEIVIVDSDGSALIDAIVEPVKDRKLKRRQMYEQTGSSYSGQA